jgi:hypothetical protein
MSGASIATEKKDGPINQHYFDISRIEKNIFSNPFNFQKLGIAMASTCYHRHMKKNYKKFPSEFLRLKEYKLLCRDKDCFPSICHKKVLEDFLKKI